MVKNAVKGLFRAASNLFSSVDNSSEPFFERFMDSVSQFRAKCREFEYRDIIAWIRKITQKQIQPIDPSNESKELVESPPQATPISS